MIMMGPHHQQIWYSTVYAPLRGLQNPREKMGWENLFIINNSAVDCSILLKYLVHCLIT